MKITICIGSSCHLKGSRQIVEGLQALVKEHGLEDKVEMGGRFCMGDCQNGVCLTVDDQKFPSSPRMYRPFLKRRFFQGLTAPRAATGGGPCPGNAQRRPVPCGNGPCVRPFRRRAAARF